jgi:hypothetical protein
MKKTVALASLVLFVAFARGQSKEYLVLETSSKVGWIYVMGKGSFIDYFADRQEQIGEHTYSVRIRQYSWNKFDTAYYRAGEENYVSCNRQTGKETIEIPKKPVAGQSWYESDSSWVYTISSTDARLSTPVKNYKNLVEIQATQVTGRDKQKYTTYRNFYARGIGYVGSIVDGKLLSYLKEMKRAE